MWRVIYTENTEVFDNGARIRLGVRVYWADESPEGVYGGVGLIWFTASSPDHAHNEDWEIEPLAHWTGEPYVRVTADFSTCIRDAQGLFGTLKSEARALRFDGREWVES